MQHIALLRALNVGGNNRITMTALVAVFEAAGAKDVSTYIQSGNVLFRASSPQAVARKVEAALRAQGIKTPVVLRTPEELTAALHTNPFVKEGVSLDALSVAFLEDVPAPSDAAKLDPTRSPHDRFALIGRDLFLHFGKGTAGSKLTNVYLDATLQTVSTVRNWKTLNALVALSEAATVGRTTTGVGVRSRKR